MNENETGARLRFARERWDLSQPDLADRSGVDAATIRQVESGAVEPDQLTARKLADAIAVRVEWLLTGDGDMEEPWRRVADSGEAAWYLEIERVEPGTWFRDDDDEWQVDRTAEGMEQR